MATKPVFNLTHPGKEVSSIVLIFSYKSKKVRIAAGLSVPVKFWNFKTQRLKETQAFPFHRQYNQRLNDISHQCSNLWAEYQAQGIIPTIETFREALKGLMFKIEQASPGIIDFIQTIIREREGLNRPKGSIQVYKNCLGHLLAFQHAKRTKFTFDSLNHTFLPDFTGFLFAQDYADSYVHKVVTTLLMFVREAERRGLVVNPPILRSKIEVKKREADTVYLSEEELQILFNMPLQGRLANVRDLFLFGCYTGLRFSDFSEIKKENIQPIEHEGQKIEAVVVTTKKNKERVIIPLTNQTLKTILARHGGQAPRKISLKSINLYAKELCQLAGFTQEIEINSFRAGRHLKSKVQKWELVGSHTARRSFATNAYKSGMPPLEIMRFTGHKTLASFLKYIRVSLEEAAVMNAQHKFFTGSKED